jgi:hypothetical protein
MKKRYAAPSDKKKLMWVHKRVRSRKSEGSFGRNGDGGIFARSNLGRYLEIPEDKKLPGTLCLAPHIIMDDKAFHLKTYLLIAEQR